MNRKRKKYTRKPRERNEAEKEAILFANEVTFGFGVNEPSICICWYLSYNILPAVKRHIVSTKLLVDDIEL